LFKTTSFFDQKWLNNIFFENIGKYRYRYRTDISNKYRYRFGKPICWKISVSDRY